MVHEGILARMGRLIAAIASQTIDSAEEGNKVALVKQAIREIDAGADEARAALGKSRARNSVSKAGSGRWPTRSRALTEKIRMAMAEGRDDLARAGAARQIDLESQGAALERAFDFIELEIEEQTKALQAMLGARREAEIRLADLEEASHSTHRKRAAGHDPAVRAAGAERAVAAIARVTGVPSGQLPADKDLDELDRMHRDKAIAERLQRDQVVQMIEMLLQPDVRPFAIAAAMLIVLALVEAASMLVGFSLSDLGGKEIDFDAAHVGPHRRADDLGQRRTCAPLHSDPSGAGIFAVEDSDPGRRACLRSATTRMDRVAISRRRNDPVGQSHKPRNFARDPSRRNLCRR